MSLFRPEQVSAHTLPQDALSSCRVTPSRIELTIGTERRSDNLAQLADSRNVPQHSLLETGHVLHCQSRVSHLEEVDGSLTRWQYRALLIRYGGKRKTHLVPGLEEVWSSCFGNFERHGGRECIGRKGKRW
jgi:hypothetical protein